MKLLDSYVNDQNRKHSERQQGAFDAAKHNEALGNYQFAADLYRKAGMEEDAIQCDLRVQAMGRM